MSLSIMPGWSDKNLLRLIRAVVDFGSPTDHENLYMVLLEAAESTSDVGRLIRRARDAASSMLPKRLSGSQAIAFMVNAIVALFGADDPQVLDRVFQHCRDVPNTLKQVKSKLQGVAPPADPHGVLAMGLAPSEPPVPSADDLRRAAAAARASAPSPPPLGDTGAGVGPVPAAVTARFPPLSHSFVAAAPEVGTFAPSAPAAPMAPAPPVSAAGASAASAGPPVFIGPARFPAFSPPAPAAAPPTVAVPPALATVPVSVMPTTPAAVVAAAAGPTAPAIPFHRRFPGLPYDLDEAQMARLLASGSVRRLLPAEYARKRLGATPHLHGELASERLLAEEICHVLARRHCGDVAVLDIGAAAARNEVVGRTNTWGLAPVLTSADALRQQLWECSRITNYCTHVAEEAPVKGCGCDKHFGAIVAVYSLWYMDPAEVVAMLRRYTPIGGRAPLLYAVVHHFPAARGVLPHPSNPEATYVVGGEDVSMTVVGNNQVYQHSTMAWLQTGHVQARLIGTVDETVGLAAVLEATVGSSQVYRLMEVAPDLAPPRQRCSSLRRALMDGVVEADCSAIDFADVAGRKPVALMQYDAALLTEHSITLLDSAGGKFVLPRQLISAVAAELVHETSGPAALAKATRGVRSRAAGTVNTSELASVVSYGSVLACLMVASLEKQSLQLYIDNRDIISGADSRLAQISRAETRREAATRLYRRVTYRASESVRADPVWFCRLLAVLACVCVALLAFVAIEPSRASALATTAWHWRPASFWALPGGAPVSNLTTAFSSATGWTPRLHFAIPANLDPVLAAVQTVLDDPTDPRRADLYDCFDASALLARLGDFSLSLQHYTDCVLAVMADIADSFHHLMCNSPVAAYFDCRTPLVRFLDAMWGLFDEVSTDLAVARYNGRASFTLHFAVVIAILVVVEEGLKHLVGHYCGKYTGAFALGLFEALAWAGPIANAYGRTAGYVFFFCRIGLHLLFHWCGFFWGSVFHVAHNLWVYTAAAPFPAAHLVSALVGYSHSLAGTAVHVAISAGAAWVASRALVRADTCFETELGDSSAPAAHPGTRFWSTGEPGLCEARYAGFIHGPHAVGWEPFVARRCHHATRAAIYHRIVRAQFGLSEHWMTIIRNMRRRIQQQTESTVAFALWAARFPYRKAQEFYAVRHDPPSPTTGVFLKVENLHKHRLVGTDPVPLTTSARTIQTRKPAFVARYGRHLYGVGQAMKRVYAGDEDDPRFVWTAGLNPEAIGAVVERVASTYHGKVLLTDFSKFDSTQNAGCRAFEEAHNVRMGMRPGVARRFRAQCEVNKGHARVPHSSLCYHFKTVGRRVTGCPSTSTGNGPLNAHSAGAFFDQRGWRYCVVFNGDDGVIFCDEPFSLTEFDAWMRDCGFEAKSRFADDWHDIDFCSSLFWPTADGRVLGPKPGRLASRLFCSSGLPLTIANRWTAGVIVGTFDDVYHVPIARSLLSLARRLSPRAKAYFDRAALARPHVAKRHDVTAEAYIMASQRYGVSVDAIRELEGFIETSDTWDLRHPVLDIVCAVDL